MTAADVKAKNRIGIRRIDEIIVCEMFACYSMMKRAENRAVYISIIVLNRIREGGNYFAIH